MKKTFLFFLITVLAQASLVAQFGKLKKLVDKAIKISELNISEEDEIALGEVISQKLRETLGVVQDEEVTRYVTLVGKVVAEKSSRPGLPYKFIVLDSSSINAFAAPGGVIHITRGTLAALKDEAALAGVLGHEIGHVTQKHTIREIQKLKGVELGADETSLRNNGAVMNLIADKFLEVLFQGWSRSDELESDAVGLKLSFDAGYDPNGLVRFLESVLALTDSASSSSSLFASHPQTSERIEKLQEQIAKASMLDRATSVSLAERYKKMVPYFLIPEAVEEVSVAGVRGAVSGGKSAEGDKKKEKDKDEKKGRKTNFLAAMRNPTSSGEKTQTAAVTGQGAAKGATDPGKAWEETGPKNPNIVVAQVSEADLQKFKVEGKLKAS